VTCDLASYASATIEDTAVVAKCSGIPAGRLKMVALLETSKA